MPKITGKKKPTLSYSALFADDEDDGCLCSDGMVSSVCPLHAPPKQEPGAEKTKFYFSTKDQVPSRKIGDVLKEKKAAVVAADSLVSEDLSPHLIVKARAGTGKTTTLVEGLRLILEGSTKITPSPQQQVIWDCLMLSKGVARTVGFVAFNRSIADELRSRVPRKCDAMTMHGMGMKAVMKVFPTAKAGDDAKFKVANIIADLMSIDYREIRKNPNLLKIAKATEELVSLCKMNLVGLNGEEGFGVLPQLAAHYEVEMPYDRQKVYDLVPRALERCKDVVGTGMVDYDDMIWLPIALDLKVFKYDLLLIDEGQDLNRCQQALAKKAGHRLGFVGDDKQAIYSFAGADAESLLRLQRELEATERGVKILPLTVTRRCGKAIVEEARKLVPDFEAHESNALGSVEEAVYPIQYDSQDRPYEVEFSKTYMAQVKPGDFVICRVNAPLVSQCFKFLKRGIRANIQGRDIGRKLAEFVKKYETQTIEAFVSSVTDWGHQEEKIERAKREPSDVKLITIQDRVACLLAFTEGASAVHEVLRKINDVFTDEKNQHGGIRLSSIHKAKGLEARTVFFLMPRGGQCPHPCAKSRVAIEQELNLRYVATTRAIEKLVYVY